VLPLEGDPDGHGGHGNGVHAFRTPGYMFWIYKATHLDLAICKTYANDHAV
jgi:hypothetical protein